MTAAYNEWLRSTGVERWPAPSTPGLIAEELRATAAQIDRRRRTIDHAPTSRARDSVINKIAALEAYEIELVNRLGDAQPIAPRPTCPKCGRAATESELYPTGKCRPCSNPIPTT